MTTAAVFDGDEVWDFGTSSEEEDIDSDEVFQDEEEEPPSPRTVEARSAAQQAIASSEGGAAASAESMAALVGRLRCDNLELRKALVEAQREGEAAAMAFQREQAERRRLQATLEQAARDRAAEEAAQAAQLRAQLPPVAEAEEAEEQAPASTPSAPSSAGAAVAAAPPASGVGAAGAEGDLPMGPSEGEQRIDLERQLVSSKIKCASAVERSEGLEALVEYYEGQLKSLNPNFRPADIAAIGRSKQGLPAAAAAQPGSEVDSSSPHTPGLSPHTPSQSPPGKEKHHRSGKHRIKKWAGRMFGSGHSHSPSAALGETGEPDGLREAASRLPSASEDIARQREVISCLMAELEKANQKINRYKAAKSKKKKGHHAAEAEDPADAAA